MQPEEVAKAICFLCSKEAKHITGHIMKVDGGHALTSSNWFPWTGIANVDHKFEPTTYKLSGKIDNLIGRIGGLPMSNEAL